MADHYPASPLAGDPTELVRLARQGSAEALAALYRRYGALVYRTARRIGDNDADAEDVVQDVFLGLPKALDRYQEQGRLEAWLRRLTARTALMRLRRHRRETSLDDGPEPSGPEAPAAGAVDRIAVADALARLPASLRTAFVLKEVEGFSHREIAALLEITVAASEVRLHRAWNRIRELLGPGEES